MGSSWRRFNFFSEEEVGYLDESTACCGLDDGGLARGDAQGVCHLLDPTMRERSAFAAHERGVTHLLQPRGSTLLFSLGLELEGAVERTFMRVWRPEAAAADGTAPCLRHVKLFERPQPEPTVTCWCVADDLTQVVCGLSDGTVLLLRSADLLKERYLRFKAVPSFAAPAAAPVTAVHLSHLQRGGAPAELFVLTADAVFSVSGAGLRHEARKVLAEAGGAAPGCSCLSDDEQLVVGTAQALYFYSAEERGPCFAFDGPKRLLCWHRSFVLVATRPPPGGGGGGGGGGATDEGGDGGQDAAGGGWMLQVYDLKNKLVAYSARIAGAPKWLLSGSDRALVVAANGAVVALREQPLSVKLELLYRKQLYPTALALLQAQPHGFEPAVLADIHRQYAEHLYAKADYDGAVDQWVLTLGEVQTEALL